MSFAEIVPSSFVTAEPSSVMALMSPDTASSAAAEPETGWRKTTEYSVTSGIMVTCQRYVEVSV